MGFEQITGPNSIAPPPPAGDVSNRVATTAFVSTAISAAIAGISFPYPNLTVLTNSISSDHGLTNVSSYFDGPTVAQGSTGVWFASGTLTVVDTAGSATINVKLWDGTTVIASAACFVVSSNARIAISLSGVITNPVANLKISARDTTSTNGLILFNFSGNSKDSTLTAVRIG